MTSKIPDQNTSKDFEDKSELNWSKDTSKNYFEG